MATLMQGQIQVEKQAFGVQETRALQRLFCGWDMANHHRQGEQILGVLGATSWEKVHKTRLRRRR